MNVELIDVVKDFRGAGPNALRGVSLVAQSGEITSLVGASGCGKTTTLRCIAGLETIDGGEIRFGSEVMSKAGRPIVPTATRNVGMVFQSYALWPHLTVEDNVAFGLRMRGRGKASIAKRVTEVLTAVNLAELKDRYPAQLSGGQQQRVALGRALAYEPRVLLLDEPLANLDTHLRGQMRQEIRRLQRTTGKTMIYVTHDRAEAMELSDRIVVLANGSVVQIGSPTELFENPANLLVARFLGHSNFLGARVERHEAGVSLVETTFGRCSLNAAAFHGTDVVLLVAGDALRIASRKEDVPAGWLSGSAKLLSKTNAAGGAYCTFTIDGGTLELFVADRMVSVVNDQTIILIDPSKCQIVPGEKHDA